MLPPPHSVMINNFEIVHSAINPIDLKILEAIVIKAEKPIINVKYNELYNILNLF